MALEVTKDIISFRNSVREVARPNQFQVELDFPVGLAPASPSALAEFGTFQLKEQTYQHLLLVQLKFHTEEES
mgnify:CR=1 FL=1